MNKKGQTLVLFIIIMPIIFLLIASVFELSLVEYNKKHLLSVTKTIIINSIDTPEKNDIINLYDKNGITYESIDVIIEENQINIKIDTAYESLLGKLIGKEDYKYHLDITGYKENENIKFKKG